MRKKLSALLLAALSVASVLATTGTAAATESVGRIGGFIWWDRNGNGSWLDSGEPRREGAKIIAHHEGTNVDFVTFTDANGEYDLKNLPLGTYQVHAVDDGYYTTTGWNTHERTLTDDRPGSEVFGHQGTRLHGRAWTDIDRDGIREAEDLLREATFTLKGQTDHEGPISRTATTVNGEYYFEDLPSGTFTMETPGVSGLTATRYQAGDYWPNWYRNNDFTGTDLLKTEPFTMYAADYEPNIDAGFTTP